MRVVCVPRPTRRGLRSTARAAVVDRRQSILGGSGPLLRSSALDHAGQLTKLHEAVAGAVEVVEELVDLFVSCC